MSDLSVRIALVAVAIIVTIATSAFLRFRAAGPSRRVSGVELGPGIYFFSSVSCLECQPSQTALIDRLGAAGFVEYTWEKEPSLFQKLGVDAVPATLLVDGDGSATLWPGPPDKMFSSVDP